MKIRFFLISIALLILTGIAAPTAGDYQTRLPSIWYKDPITKPINGFTQIMCMLNKLHPEENVDKGPYSAKVNFSYCNPGAVKAATDKQFYFTVNTISDSSTGGYVVQAWLTAIESNGSTSQLSPPSAFQYAVTDSTHVTLNVCFDIDSGTSACGEKLFLTLDGQSVEVHNNLSSAGGLGGYFHLAANVSDSAGWGSVKSSYLNADSGQPSGKIIDHLDVDYAYSGTNAVLNVIVDDSGDSAGPTPVIAAGQTCIDRRKSLADWKVNNYEVFKADGSQYVSSTPLDLNFTVDSPNNVTGLVNSALNQTQQSLTYRYHYNAYGWNSMDGVPWDNVTSTSGYIILPGASAIGANDGLTYFVKPMQYEVTPASVACPANANTLIAAASVTRAQIPANPQYTGAIDKWIDPRTAIGSTAPTVSGGLSYIDGVKQ